MLWVKRGLGILTYFLGKHETNFDVNTTLFERYVRWTKSKRCLYVCCVLCFMYHNNPAILEPELRDH